MSEHRQEQTQPALPAPQPRKKEVATQRKVIDTLTPAKRKQMNAFKRLLDFLLTLTVSPQTVNQQIIEFEQRYLHNKLPTDVIESLRVLRGKKALACPDRSTLYRWIDKLDRYQNGNHLALTQQHTGRQRQAYGWEPKAIELFNMPSKPGYADVAFWLRNDHGFPSATNSRVNRYLKTLPETLGKQSPHRMGKNFYKHNLAPYKIRDNEVLPVGFGYEGDGHTVDVYLAHPITGNLYRPEITVWIDVRSRFLVGWYLSDAESAVSTLFALSEALLAHDHVPSMLFLDNGSGFKARMMTDDVSGFFSRMAITPSFALPGNSKGKGLVESFFKIFRNKHDKKEEFKQSYCGHDMAAEINRRLPDLVKRGKRKLPSMDEYTASVRKFIDDYNNEPKGVLEGKSPRQVWEAGLQRVPVHVHADALVQPRALRTVGHFRIRLDNRQYQAAELAQYNGRQVLVQYSLHHDGEIRVLDEQERLICIARLVSKVDRLPESRIEEKRQKSEAASIQRQENKIHEIKQRNKPLITVEENTASLLDCSDFSRLEEAEDFDPNDALWLGAPRKEAGDEGDSDLINSF